MVIKAEFPHQRSFVDPAAPDIMVIGVFDPRPIDHSRQSCGIAFK